MKRANALLTVGALLVVVGAGLAWTVTRDDGDDEPRRRAPVLVAVADLEPGQLGDDLIASGKVRVEQVDVTEAADGALSSTAGLSGTIVGTSVPEGHQIVAEALRSSALRGDSFTIPDGQEAVAVTVPFTAGVAGYIAPGDRVNVYASIAPDTPDVPVSPRTELLLGDVEVLDISNEVAPRRADPVVSADGTSAAQPARAGTGEITLLLAVDPVQAEQVVFASTNNQLWFTLAPEGGGANPPPGVDYRTYGPAEDQ